MHPHPALETGRRASRRPLPTSGAGAGFRAFLQMEFKISNGHALFLKVSYPDPMAIMVDVTGAAGPSSPN